MRTFKFKSIALFIFFAVMASGCRRNNYASFQKSEPEVFRKSENKFKVLNQLKSKQKTDFFSHIYLFPNVEIPDTAKKVENKRKVKQLATTKNLEQPNNKQSDKPKKRNVNYEKVGRVAGILGLATIPLFYLVGISAVLISIAALVLGIISVKKVRKKLMPTLGIVLGILGILFAIAVIIVLILVLFVLFGA